MTIAFTLPILAIPKGRPRMGQGGRIYTPDKTRSFEDQFSMLARCHMPRDPLDGPVSVLVSFGMPSAKYLPASPHTFRPDLDNLVKAVLDPLNGLAWLDDSQVYDLRLRKVWSREPCIHMEITDG